KRFFKEPTIGCYDPYKAGLIDNKKPAAAVRELREGYRRGKAFGHQFESNLIDRRGRICLRSTSCKYYTKYTNDCEYCFVQFTNHFFLRRLLISFQNLCGCNFP